jgi:hypothetical protein
VDAGVATMGTAAAAAAAAAAASAAAPPAADTCRALECDVGRLVAEYLGRPVPAFGKAPAVALASATRGVTPRFSK